jgi:uncharacterized membrane protein
MSSISFSEQDRLLIKEAVAKAELKTSGEIRICIEDTCPLDVLDRSAYIFKELGINKTKDRNGVLIYVSLDDRKYAIIGDAGIHLHVKQEFWDHVGSEMIALFKQGKLVDGLIHAVMRAGEKLSVYFPYHKHDKNELSDDIFFGDKNS